jgi:hypothetical protein
MAERTSDRALLNEAIDLLCGCAPMAWIAKDLNDAAEYEKQITAFIARVRTLDAAAPAQAGEWVTVPREAPPGLLVSMAIRADHGLGCPGYYDTPMFSSDGIGHKRRMEAAVATARQMHEEVVGTGFYTPEREASYAAMLSAAPPAPQPATAGQPPTDYGDSGSKSVVPTAEHWRRAVDVMLLGNPTTDDEWSDVVKRAVALAREEGK